MIEDSIVFAEKFSAEISVLDRIIGEIPLTEQDRTEIQSSISRIKEIFNEVNK